jgi:hypothetical protein
MFSKTISQAPQYSFFFQPSISPPSNSVEFAHFLFVLSRFDLAIFIVLNQPFVPGVAAIIRIVIFRPGAIPGGKLSCVVATGQLLAIVFADSFSLSREEF